MCLFHTTVDDHAHLLNQKEYDEISLQNGHPTGYLVEQLEEVFEKICSYSRGSNELQHFFLETQGSFSNGKDILHFKFHYQYHPSKEELHLKSLVVRMEDMQKILFLMSSRNLPAASKVYEGLVHDRDTKIARKLMETNSRAKQRKIKP